MVAMIAKRVDRLNATGKSASANLANTQCKVSAVIVAKQSSQLSRY